MVPCPERMIQLEAYRGALQIQLTVFPRITEPHVTIRRNATAGAAEVRESDRLIRGNFVRSYGRHIPVLDYRLAATARCQVSDQIERFRAYSCKCSQRGFRGAS